jgi:hypothetical protein
VLALADAMGASVMIDGNTDPLTIVLTPPLASGATKTLPTPKECNACGCAGSDLDDPLVLWGHARSRNGVAIGWVHQGCAAEMFKRQVEVLGAEPGDYVLKWQQ